MKIHSLFLYFIGFLISPLGLGTETNEAEEKQPGPPFTLSVEDHSLSFKGNGAYLGDVLQELGRQARIKVQVAESVAEEKVLVSFDRFPLAQGIQLLLKGRNYVLTYSEPVARGSESTSQQVSEIRVLPDGEKTADAAPPQQAAPEKQSANEDSSADPPSSQAQEETEKKDVDFGPN